MYRRFYTYTKTSPNLTHQSHVNEEDYLKSTIRFSLCYCIPKECWNPLYTRKYHNRFMPAVSKSPPCHLHSKLSRILATRSILTTSSNWYSLYFLLCFKFVSACSGYFHSVFADLLLLKFKLLLLLLLLLLSSSLLLFHLFVVLFFLFLQFLCLLLLCFPRL